MTAEDVVNMLAIFALFACGVVIFANLFYVMGTWRD